MRRLGLLLLCVATAAVAAPFDKSGIADWTKVPAAAPESAFTPPVAQRKATPGFYADDEDLGSQSGVKTGDETVASSLPGGVQEIHAVPAPLWRRFIASSTSLCVPFWPRTSGERIMAFVPSG